MIIIKNKKNSTKNSPDSGQEKYRKEKKSQQRPTKRKENEISEMFKGLWIPGKECLKFGKELPVKRLSGPFFLRLFLSFLYRLDFNNVAQK